MGFTLLKPKRSRCQCFLQHGAHEFVRVTDPDESNERYHCLYCGASSEEAILSEQEWAVAWHAGRESEYLKSLAGIPGRWGIKLPWVS